MKVSNESIQFYEFVELIDCIIEDKTFYG